MDGGDDADDFDEQDNRFEDKVPWAFVDCFVLAYLVTLISCVSLRFKRRHLF